ncbi:MAG: hypothetical protein KDA78_18590, partial [Planctomycetaceae bacterium]|nr:hypothetical protein [Planctomycetaceae bacterium]
VILEVIGTGDVILTGTVITAGDDFPAGQAFDAGNVQLIAADGSLIVTKILATGGAGAQGGNAGDIQLDATGGSILLQGELNAVGGAGSPIGASGLISLTASYSILDANDGVAMIRGGDFSALAGVRIGEISDFATGSGNGIELELTGQVIQAEVTSAGGEIHLRGTGDLIFATGSLIPGAGTAADVVLFSTGDLDLGQNPGAVVTSDGDRINLLAEQVLVLPNDGLDVGSGELRLKGVLDVVDPLGRSLGELRSEKLVFFSGAAGGDTELNTAVHLLDATISTPGQNLTINEADGLVIQQILVPDAVVTINAATVTSGDVEVFLVDAGTGRIVVDTTASGGGLIHSAATDASLKSSELALLVTTGIANNDLLIVEADVLAAATVSGDIHIQNLTDSLRIGQVGVLSGLTISAGTAADNILIETLQSLQVERAVTANGAAVDLAVSANSGAQLTVQAAISADESITLTSGGQLLLESGAAVMSSQGNILLSAGENRGFATLNTVVDQGSILMNPLAILQTDDGAIKLFSTGDVEISQLVALGSTHPEAGLISITADFQGVDQSLATFTGAITESTPESVTNLRGSQLQLMASTGVGANDDLRVETQTVQVTNLTGDIQLTQIAGATEPTVELNDIQNDQGAITIRSEDGAILTRNVQVTTAGSISLRAEDAGADGGSDLTVEGSVQTASGEIELLSASRDILLDGIIESLAGAITVRSDLSGTGQITMTDGSVIHAADG